MHHYKYWGKLYKPEDIKVSRPHRCSVCICAHTSKIAWHVPNDAEIDFVLQLFKDVIEPTLQLLRGLLEKSGAKSSLFHFPY